MTDPTGDPSGARPRPAHNAMVASAARIKLSERRFRHIRPQDWQREAWHYFDVIGEIYFATTYLANHLAKMRLYPAMVPDDPRDVPTPDSSEEGKAALTALRGTAGGYSEILREAALNLQVAGEGFLVGLSRATTLDEADFARIPPSGAELPINEAQEWDIKSTDELDISTDGTYTLRDYPNAPRISLDDSNAFVTRIWTRHPRWSALATSPMRGILASAEEIERIERAIRAAAKSRAAGPGLLLLPDEMSFGSVDPTRHASAENADDDPFQAEMIEAMTTAVRDEGSAAALVPILVRGPAEMLKEVRKLSLAIDIDEKLLTLDRAITRLAQGLNIPPEIITGKAELSHWVAWQVSEEVFSAHVEPLAVPIVDALTIGYYRIFLEASGMSTAEASRRMLWYDPTAIITRPNRSADADFGLEHIALSERGWRKAKNIPEEDAPTDLERLMRLVMQRGSFDPVFTSVLLKLLGLTDETITEVINQPPSPQPPRTEPAETLGPPPAVRPRRAGPPRQAATLTAAAPEPDTSDSDRPPEPEPTSTAATFARNFVIVASSSPDGSEMGLRLYDIDHDISTRLHAASSAALTRAMDRATSVIISKFRDDPQFGAVIAGMHDRRREIPSRIGIVAMQTNDLTTDDLLRDAFAPLHAQFIIWATRAYARAIRVLGLSSDESPDDLAISQTVTEAADWLVSALSALAAARLFDPSPTPEPFGEIDDSSDVPFGIVREALARAGGAAPAGIYISTAGDPMGGIATGALLLNAFSRIGGGVEGWQWVYGETVRSREFPPHHDLDGVRFSSWTDDALSNRQTWPAVSHYVPGDHAGCYCAAAPVILPPQEAVA